MISKPGFNVVTGLTIVELTLFWEVSLALSNYHLLC